MKIFSVFLKLQRYTSLILLSRSILTLPPKHESNVHLHCLYLLSDVRATLIARLLRATFTPNRYILIFNYILIIIQYFLSVKKISNFITKLLIKYFHNSCMFTLSLLNNIHMVYHIDNYWITFYKSI